MSYVFLFIGPAGSGKSTTALSGNGITGFHSFDPGSFERAVQGSPIDLDRVRMTRHWAPITGLKALGKVSASGMGMQAKHLTGWADEYNRFIDSYFVNLEDEDAEQIVFDTETGEWLMIRNGFNEQVQNAASKAEADRMSPLTYTEPNSRYEQIITASKMYGKDLILIGHMKEEWKNEKATGVMIHDGHKEAPNLADLFLEFSVVDRQPVATIRKAGAGGLELVGMKLVAPTLGDLKALLDGAALIRRNGMPLPNPLTLEAVKRTAEVLAS